MAFWSQTDAYGIYEDDDDSSEDVSSSEDEIDIILHGTLDQKKKLKRLQNKKISDRIDDRKWTQQNSSSASEDEFEKEMDAELTQHVNFLESGGAMKRSVVAVAESQPDQSNQSQTSEKNIDYYDDVYFDSDDDDDGGGDGGRPRASSRKHAVISNDDLLYDPTMDDKDQRWVDRQRRRNRNTPWKGGGGMQNKGKPAKLPSSDALLDCPACLTTLCLDCQRHEAYKQQYRAMFVMNCRVDNNEVLQCPQQPAKKKKNKKKMPDGNDGEPQNISPGGVVASDLFHSVKCTECGTVVGVIDSDEVYHFFNVLASHT